MKTAALLVAAVMVACTAFPPAADRLVGAWRYADRAKECHYIFRKDGNFRGEVRLQGKVISRFTGRWWVEGDILFYRYLSDAMHRIPIGATDRDKLLAVEEGKFTIMAGDGSHRTYVRVR